MWKKDGFVSTLMRMVSVLREGKPFVYDHVGVKPVSKSFYLAGSGKDDGKGNGKNDVEYQEVLPGVWKSVMEAIVVVGPNTR